MPPSKQFLIRLGKMEKKAKNEVRFGRSKIQVDPPRPKPGQKRGRR